MKISYTYMIFLMFFAGCHKEKLKLLPKSSFKLQKVEYEQLLAQHNEIPDPQLGFKIDSVSKDLENNQSLEIIYKPVRKKNITIQEIKKSYIADMEMLGWESIADFESDNIQIIFQKAGRKLLSTLQIESDLQVKITIYTKKN